MKFMGSEDFSQYVNADKELRELEYEQKLAIHRVYADIHPTRVEQNYETGKLYSVGQDVAEYAISIVEMKEIQKEMRDRYVKRLEIFSAAIQVLSVGERDVINQYKQSLPVLDHRLLKNVFHKLNTEIMRLINIEKREEQEKKQAEKERMALLVRQNTHLFKKAIYKEHEMQR